MTASVLVSSSAHGAALFRWRSAARRQQARRRSPHLGFQLPRAFFFRFRGKGFLDERFRSPFFFFLARIKRFKTMSNRNAVLHLMALGVDPPPRRPGSPRRSSIILSEFHSGDLRMAMYEVAAWASRSLVRQCGGPRPSVPSNLIRRGAARRRVPLPYPTYLIPGCPRSTRPQEENRCCRLDEMVRACRWAGKSRGAVRSAGHTHGHAGGFSRTTGSRTVGSAVWFAKPVGVVGLITARRGTGPLKTRIACKGRAPAAPHAPPPPLQTMIASPKPSEFTGRRHR